MNSLHIALTGEDTHWLCAVREAVNSLNQTGPCCLRLIPPDGAPNCARPGGRVPLTTSDGTLDGERRVAPGAAVLLVDATAEADIATRVSEYTDAGWREIIVVAANPNWREAHALLQGAGARDYWPKSYDVEAIRWHLAELLREMTASTADKEENTP